MCPGRCGNAGYTCHDLLARLRRHIHRPGIDQRGTPDGFDGRGRVYDQPDVNDHDRLTGR